MLSKYLKNIGLKGRRIISLPGAPTCLDPALLAVSHMEALLTLSVFVYI
jgi:hypothetical protein